MKTDWIPSSPYTHPLAFAVSVHAQSKEQDRIESAGTVVKEIMDIPDNIPQSVIDKADCVVVLPSVSKLRSSSAQATPRRK